jgi:hypothetical protein
MSGTRFFSVEDAERTLPLVRRIVADIVEGYRALQSRVREYNALASPDDGAAADPALALQRQIERQADRIDGYVAELEQLGCFFKGFDAGLVDFRARYRGRTIDLCWKLGESRIEWWHEIDGGFAGRRPLTREMRLELAGIAGPN